MTANSVLEIINATMSAEEYRMMVKNIMAQDIPPAHIATLQQEPKAEPYKTKTGGNFSSPNEK